MVLLQCASADLVAAPRRSCAWRIANFLSILEFAMHRCHKPRSRSRFRAREPVEWPALGVGDREDEHVLRVLFDYTRLAVPPNSAVFSLGLAPLTSRLHAFQNTW